MYYERVKESTMVKGFNLVDGVYLVLAWGDFDNMIYSADDMVYHDERVCFALSEEVVIHLNDWRGECLDMLNLFSRSKIDEIEIRISNGHPTLTEQHRNALAAFIKSNPSLLAKVTTLRISRLEWDGNFSVAIIAECLDVMGCLKSQLTQLELWIEEPDACLSTSKTECKLLYSALQHNGINIRTFVLKADLSSKDALSGGLDRLFEMMRPSLEILDISSSNLFSHLSIKCIEDVVFSEQLTTLTIKRVNYCPMRKFVEALRRGHENSTNVFGCAKEGHKLRPAGRTLRISYSTDTQALLCTTVANCTFFGTLEVYAFNDNGRMNCTQVQDLLSTVCQSRLSEFELCSSNSIPETEMKILNTMMDTAMKYNYTLHRCSFLNTTFKGGETYMCLNRASRKKIMGRPTAKDVEEEDVYMDD